MSTTRKDASKSSLSKKEVRHQIALKLETALADFKPSMSEKKFKSRIKKASKLFSEHIGGASKTEPGRSIRKFSANGSAANASATGTRASRGAKKSTTPAKKTPSGQKKAAAPVQAS